MEKAILLPIPLPPRRSSETSLGRILFSRSVNGSPWGRLDAAEDVCLVVVLQISDHLPSDVDRLQLEGLGVRKVSGLGKCLEDGRPETSACRFFPEQPKIFRDGCPGARTLSSPRVRIRGPAHEGGCSGRDPCYDVHGLTVKAMLPERPGRLA